MLIQVRQGTAASAASNNPALAGGEPSYETDTGILKIGDGSTLYNDMPAVNSSPNLIGFTPPPTTGWTNLGTPTITSSYKSRLSTEASAAANWRGEYRTLSPATNYTATFYFDWATPNINYAQAGAFIRNSAGTALIHFGAQYGTGPNLSVRKYSSPTAFSSTPQTAVASDLVGGTPNWLRIRDDSTNRYYEYSYNGVDWVLFHSSVRTDFVTPNQIGWGQNPEGSVGSYTSRARLRHYTLVSP